MLKIMYRDADRDFRQAKFGMGTTEEEAVNARPNLTSYGLNSVQTQGGTTKDLSRRNGHDQWEYSDTITNAYTDAPLPQTSLWRNICGYTYNPQPHGVLVDLLVEELRTFQGTQTPYYLLDVFEGTNALAPMEDTAEVLKEANEIIKKEYGESAVIARARGTLCIDDKRDLDDNPILDLDELVAHAGKLLDLGYEGIYIKSASGRVGPEFIGELADKIYTAHGHRMTIEMGVHIHDTYGEAIPSMVKATEAAAKHGMPIELDGLPPAASGWVAHPDYVLLNEILEAHSNPVISEAAKEARLNQDAIDADEPHIYDLNSHYSHKTIRYVPENFQAAYDIHLPGGAAGPLYNHDNGNTRKTLEGILKTTDWDEIQTAIFKMAKEIKADLGYPTMVTPYADIVLTQAAICITNEHVSGNRFNSLTLDASRYLVGNLGEAPKHAKPELIQQASDYIDHVNNTTGSNIPKSYVRAKDIPDPRKIAREKLIEAGIEQPTKRQVLSAVMVKEGLEAGIEYVVSVHNGTNKPINNRKCLYEEPHDNSQSTNGKMKELFSGEAVGKKAINKNPKAIKTIENMGGYGTLEKVAQSALMLKLMEDGKRPFPDYAKDLHTREIERLRSVVVDFIGAQQAPKKEDGLSKVFLTSRLNVLHDFLEAKGKGLYQHVMQNIKNHPAVAIKPPHKGRSLAPKSRWGDPGTFSPQERPIVFGKA